LFDRIKQQFLSNKNNKEQQHEQTYLFIYFVNLLFYWFDKITVPESRLTPNYKNYLF